MEESDHLFSCPFCGVRHAVISPEVPSYVFAKRSKRGSLFLVPYHRFKGNVFTCREDDVVSRFVDVSVRAVPLDQAPLSLGMRTQSVPVSFAPESPDGVYLDSSLEISSVLDRAVKSIPGKDNDAGFLRAFLGEVISRVYLPLYIEGKVIIDGLSGKKLGIIKGGTKSLDKWIAKEAPERPRLVPALCPECGSDLAGEGKSLVFTCSDCGGSWETAPSGLRRITCHFAGCTKSGLLNLPFWKMEIGVSAPERPADNDLPKMITMWTPAFKIKPELFLQLARRLTSSPRAISLTKNTAQGGLYPVSLPRSEALQAVKLVFYECSNRKGIIGPLLAGMQVVARAVDLCYLPFDQSGYDLVCLCMPLAINKNSLKFGRCL